MGCQAGHLSSQNLMQRKKTFKISKYSHICVLNETRPFEKFLIWRLNYDV